ncbi:MAG: RelA/SpoT family protein, partial [Christensenellales bacterium]
MDKQIEQLVEKLKKVYSGEKLEIILLAIEFARAAHKGQMRESGEEYFTHPCYVAEILVDLDMDASTIAAALLHDVLEDTPVSREQILSQFGQEILDLVEGVTKLNKIEFKSKEEEQAENLRKMFFAMAKDIRVLIIKLADRLHNMRSLSSLPRPRQLAMARETLDIYAPLAGRLGISQIKCELDDLSMRYLYPEDYYDLVQKVAIKRQQRNEIVEKICAELTDKLKELNIKGEVFGRPKHLYSIYKKMVMQGKQFEQIYDLIAVRVIVENIKDCYAVLGAIHSMWKPIPGRFKDYIAMPKPNLYQSLHTTVVTNFGSPLEIQIRTYEMHAIAEYGIAAHWRYKEG